MDEFTADAFVNRDEPVPVIAPVALQGKDAPSSDAPKGKRERLKDSLAVPTAKLKGKLQETGWSSSKDYGYSLQDRLFTK